MFRGQRRSCSVLARPYRAEEGQVYFICGARAAPCGAGAAADEPGGAQALGGAAACCAAGAPRLQARCLIL